MTATNIVDEQTTLSAREVLGLAQEAPDSQVARDAFSFASMILNAAADAAQVTTLAALSAVPQAAKLAAAIGHPAPAIHTLPERKTPA